LSRSAPIWDQVYLDLRDAITRGAMAPGSKIPSQEHLAELYKVPRHAVRRAFDVLKDENLIGSWQGRGAYVQTRTLDYRINQHTRFAENMRENGSIVRVEILSLRTKRRTPAEIAPLLQVSQREPVLIGEIMHFVDDVPTTIGRHYFDPKRFPRMLEFLTVENWSASAFKLFGVDQYTRSQTSVRTRTPTPYEAVSLDIAHAQPVFELRGRNVDGDGNPIEVTEAIVRGDCIQLVI